VIDDMFHPELRTPADVGALIRDRRRALRLGQAALARMTGVSRLWVNQVERGKPGASLNLVLRALNALGVTLLVDTPDRTSAPEPAELPPIITADIDTR
jgi:transcriptional regulator with XRE-family HTH domain